MFSFFMELVGERLISRSFDCFSTWIRVSKIFFSFFVLVFLLFRLFARFFFFFFLFFPIFFDLSSFYLEVSVAVTAFLSLYFRNPFLYFFWRFLTLNFSSCDVSVGPTISLIVVLTVFRFWYEFRKMISICFEFCFSIFLMSKLVWERLFV